MTTEDELRELDVFCAEKVMGWQLVNYNTGCEAACYAEAMNNDGWTWSGDYGDGEAWQWKPTTDSACAMRVFEKCIRKCGEVMICFNGMYSVHGCLSGQIRPVYGQHAETLPLAICEFAKKLYGK